MKQKYSLKHELEDFHNFWSELPDNDPQPERQLLIAMLKRACLDYMNGDRETAEWFTDEIGAFSFREICLYLDLNADAILRGLKLC